jgi:hypothetical protein
VTPYFVMIRDRTVSVSSKILVFSSHEDQADRVWANRLVTIPSRGKAGIAT